MKKKKKEKDRFLNKWRNELWRISSRGTQPLYAWVYFHEVDALLKDMCVDYKKRLRKKIEDCKKSCGEE